MDAKTVAAITLEQRLAYGGVKALEALLRGLSWRQAQWLGGFLGTAASKVWRSRWNLTLNNLRFAFPDKTEKQLRALALEIWQNNGKTGAELIKSRHLSNQEVESLCRFENFEVVEKLIASGRGGILHTGHLGNWEVAGTSIAPLRSKLAGIARHIKNPLIDRWLLETRQMRGSKVIYHHDPFFSAARHIKHGGFVGILMDQNLHQGGVFVPFFGRPAATTTLTALLAVKLGCPVIGFNIWREGPQIVGRFEEPLYARRNSDPEQETLRMTAELTGILEKWIRQRPDNWLWGHNRWKRVPGAEDKMVEAIAA